MLSVLLMMSLTQAPVTLASPPFSFAGVDPSVGRAWEERFLGRLASARLKVTSSSDIQQLIGLERQKQLLGCDSSSCLAELAGALGVELLLSGRVVKSESGYVATLRVLRTSNGQPVATASERLKSEAALLDWLDDVAVSLRAQVLGGEAAVASASWPRWVPAIGGGLALVGAGVAFAVAGADYGKLTTSGGLDATAAHTLRTEGETAQWVGVGLVGAGATAVVVSVLWNALAPPDAKTSVQPIAAVNSSGGLVGIRGQF